ncbi:MAG TPA: SusC/RagA family TonB-linked outer membrane protein [Longimicrobium sp.]|nr:SusC/RagA family TonB-linked outer membrane protein [Longimicrobium sp.]
MRRRFVGSLIAALFAASPLYAQQTGQITGRVTSADGGRALPGATVTVSGQTLRAVTGPEGRYTISGVRPGEHQVTATVIGHTAATLPVSVLAGQAATANFSLQPSALALQGVVAIGYGEQRARDRTGSVQTVTPEQFNTGRVVTAEQLIQGKVAGVQVNDTGEPGGRGNIRIRGGTSVNASNEPLFVVDGVPLQAGGGIVSGRGAFSGNPNEIGDTRNPLAFLNPNDIESVTVLKDASATAIYGSRGANGVILITTRSGARGAQFTYSTSLSTSRVARQAELLSTDQFRSAVQQYAASNVALLGNASTDWRQEVEQNAGGQEHNLAVAGTGQAMNYRLSLGYLDQTGVLRGTDTRRFSGAANYNQQLFSNQLRLRANVRGSRIVDHFTPAGVLGSAFSYAPTQPTTNADGTFFEWADANAPNNPLADLALVRDRQNQFRTLGNLEANYDPSFFKGFTGTVRAGYDYNQIDRTIFNPIAVRGSSGSVTRREPSRLGTVLDLFGRYARALDGLDSNVDVTGGYSYESTRDEYPVYVATGLFSDVTGPNGSIQANSERNDLSVQEWRLASFFGRMNWNLKDRYLLTLSVRRDGSSRFGPSHQWGTFPSAAFAWRLSEEPFFPTLGPLSEVKLRASYGVNGNQDFLNYLWVSSYETGLSTAQAQFGNGFVSTIRPSAVDPDIKWEETTSYNLGLDYGLWNGRITGTIDYYDKRTEDLIFSVPVAAGTNLSNFVTTNIGSMKNRGLELGLNARVLEGRGGGLSWDASLNAATNRNRLVRINSVGGVERFLAGGISGGVGSNIQVLQPGAPVYSFFVYEHIRDANGKPIYADTNNDGTINENDLYRDLNGDGQVTEADRRALHSPAAKWILGHTSTFSLGSWDASTTLRAYLGNYAYNNVASNLGYYGLLKGGAPRNLSTSVLETGFQTAQYFSEVYVEDASFLRMDNLTLGYTFNGIRGVDNMRLYGTVQNVFTLTGYSGVDPLGGVNGVDNNVYPRSRTFSAGVSLAF